MTHVTNTKTYDPAKVDLSIGGKAITGFEPGTFINLVRSVNSYNFTIGPDGKEGIRTKSNDRSALLTLTLRQTSPSNLILSNMGSGDEEDNDRVVAIGLKNTGEGVEVADETDFSGSGWIEKPADASFAETPQGRAWQLRMAQVTMKHGATIAAADVLLAD